MFCSRHIYSHFCGDTPREVYQVKIGSRQKDLSSKLFWFGIYEIRYEWGKAWKVVHFGKRDVLFKLHSSIDIRVGYPGGRHDVQLHHSGHLHMNLLLR